MLDSVTLPEAVRSKPGNTCSLHRLDVGIASCHVTTPKWFYPRPNKFLQGVVISASFTGFCPICDVAIKRLHFLNPAKFDCFIASPCCVAPEGWVPRLRSLPLLIGDLFGRIAAEIHRDLSKHHCPPISTVSFHNLTAPSPNNGTISSPGLRPARCVQN